MKLFLIAVLCLFVQLFCVVNSTLAQIEAPDREYLFIEDQMKEQNEKKRRDELKAKRKQAAASKIGSESKLPFDINATTIRFDSTGSIIEAAGEVIITYSALVAEAMQASVNTVTNEAELKGDVRVSDTNSNLTADLAYLNLQDGSGRLENASLYFAEGDYRLKAKEVSRNPGDVYSLKDAVLTTCACPEGEDCRPWSLRADEASIQRDGYGQAWGTSLAVHDVPVLYLPYMFFPTKNERQSGFLAASIGSGRESGFTLDIPFFWAISETADATITGVYESEVRGGTDIQLRKMFSRTHKSEVGLIYFNESQRNGRLLGTNVDDLDDPTLDENRFAGYIDHLWRGEVAGQPFQFIVDGNYISDDLITREYEKEEIADSSARFVTSEAVFRTPLGSTFSLDVASEFNQALVDDDDFVLQRLPELTVSGSNSFRPFGENPYGLKLILGSKATAVNFTRKESYDGLRSELNESVRMPFYFQNIFDGYAEASLRGTQYSLSETMVVDEPEDDLDDDGDGNDIGDEVDAEEDENIDQFEDGELDKSTNRLVPTLGGRVGTVFEKVFALEEGNLIKTIGELGGLGRREELMRLKHTVEPGIRYKFVPFVGQEENPQFDSSDRLAQRNVVTYQLTQRLFGRYEPRNPYLYGIEETTPEAKDLGSLAAPGPIDPSLAFGVENPAYGADYVKLRRGSVQELATFKLSQSFDVLEERKDEDPELEPYSDVAADLILYPNEHVRLRGKTDYNANDTKFSSYLTEAQLTSKRGDSVRTRLRFVEDSIRQLESSLEVRLTDRVKVGYYSRYDDEEGEFIEQKAGLRLSSACNCWVFDMTVTDKINPDETKFAFNVTLVGLGELGNTFFSSLSGQRDDGNP